MRVQSISLLKVFLILALIFIPLQASAEDYPSKPITIICAFKAGGGTDIMARLLAKHLQEEFGQPVLVVNKPGGFGSVAAMDVQHAPADGYTIGIATSASFSYMTLNPKTAFKIEDFAFLGGVGSFPYAIVAKTGMPYTNFKELVEYSKTHENLKYTSLLPIDKLLIDHIARKEGLKLSAVPAKGGAAMVPQVLGGHVDFAASGGAHTAHVNAGNMVVLAATTKERSVFFPEVPTLKELGYDTYLELFAIIFASKNTPQPIVDKLSNALKMATSNDTYTKPLIEDYFFIPLSWGQEEAKKALLEEHALYGELIKK